MRCLPSPGPELAPARQQQQAFSGLVANKMDGAITSDPGEMKNHLDAHFLNGSSFIESNKLEGESVSPRLWDKERAAGGGGGWGQPGSLQLKSAVWEPGLESRQPGRE